MQRLSVAIPCWASGLWLRDALRSLRAQTRPADEIVIADDGSTDAPTISLLESLAQPGSPARLGLPIRVLREPHRGPGPARNAAVRATTGELVLPLDADDELEPRALQAMEAALLADPGAAFAFSHVRYFGAVRGVAVPPRYNAWLQVNDNRLVVSALVRREVYGEQGAWYAEDLEGYEDWSFWLTVVERGLRGVCVEEPLFRYRRKGGEGQLARDHARRGRLLAALRRKHAALYAEESLADLKSRWAPAIEVVDPGRNAREALRSARGKYLSLGSGEPIRAAALAELRERDVPRQMTMRDLFAHLGGAPPAAAATSLKSRVRRSLAAVLGEDRLGALLHPVTQRWLQIAPGPLRPILTASERAERRLIDLEA